MADGGFSLRLLLENSAFVGVPTVNSAFRLADGEVGVGVGVGVGVKDSCTAAVLGAPTPSIRGTATVCSGVIKEGMGLPLDGGAMGEEAEGVGSGVGVKEKSTSEVSCGRGGVRGGGGTAATLPCSSLCGTVSLSPAVLEGGAAVWRGEGGGTEVAALREGAATGSTFWRFRAAVAFSVLAALVVLVEGGAGDAASSAAGGVGMAPTSIDRRRRVSGPWNFSLAAAMALMLRRRAARVIGFESSLIGATSPSLPLPIKERVNSSASSCSKSKTLRRRRCRILAALGFGGSAAVGAAASVAVTPAATTAATSGTAAGDGLACGVASAVETEGGSGTAVVAAVVAVTTPPPTAFAPTMRGCCCKAFAVPRTGLGPAALDMLGWCGGRNVGERGPVVVTTAVNSVLLLETTAGVLLVKVFEMSPNTLILASKVPRCDFNLGAWNLMNRFCSGCVAVMDFLLDGFMAGEW